MRASRLLLLGVAAVLLAGCKAEDRDIVLLEPGVYKGQPDQQRPPEILRKLRQRVSLQAGLNAYATGIGASHPARRLVLPGGRSPDLRRLRQRIRAQGAS